MKAREEELKVIKKENRKRRKVIEAYQDMINAGATGLHAVSVDIILSMVDDILVHNLVSCMQTRVCQQ